VLAEAAEAPPSGSGCRQRPPQTRRRCSGGTLTMKTTTRGGIVCPKGGAVKDAQMERVDCQPSSLAAMLQPIW